MNKHNYLALIDWLKKHNIVGIPYDLFNQFEIGRINYKKIFEELNIFNFFPLYYVDDFVKRNEIVLQIYKKNIIFQYIYLILSPYIFDSKTTLINAFDTIHKLILKSQYNQIDIFLNSFSCNKYMKKELVTIIKKVNRFINDSKYVSYLEKKLNSKKELGNLRHSNILEMQSVITSTLTMLLVHKGNINLKDFLENIKKMSIDDYSINLLKKECNNSKLQFFEYMLNYYNNRFFYHGTNSKWLNSIKKYGLNGTHNFDYQKEISEAIKLFESYGIYKTFEGKNYVEYLNYYITDSIGSAIYYAHQSPEYFSRFCSNGYCMKLLEKVDCEAFWRRDYDACLNNVYELCKSIKMLEKDKIFVIDLFKKLWKREVNDKQKPIIFIGKMNSIEKNNYNFKELKNELNIYSFNQIYNIFTTGSNVHNQRFSSINKDFYAIIELPNFYNLYKIKQTDFPQKKYITNDNKKYFPDIVIKNDYHKDIYFILSNSKKIQKISNTIYLIPNKFEDINGYIDSLFYKQNLKYLLLTNGIGLTNKGKNYLINNNIEFQKIYLYYLNLSIQLINDYTCTLKENDKKNLYSCIANNIFYNLYIMKKTRKLPCLVDYGYKSTLHYDYDNNNYWYRSNAENNIDINRLDSIIDKINHILNNIINENNISSAFL